MDEKQENEKNDLEEDPNKKLEKLLEAAEEKGHLLAEKGRLLTQEGQNIADVAKATLRVARFTFHFPDIEIQ